MSNVAHEAFTATNAAVITDATVETLESLYALDVSWPISGDQIHRAKAAHISAFQPEGVSA